MDALHRIVVLLTLTIAAVLANPCDPPIEGCSCGSQATMVCKNLAAFPDSLPDTVKELVIDSCAEGMPNTLPSLNYPSLDQLIITNCKLSMISVDSFTNMENLKLLDLANNELGIVDKEDFAGLSNLYDINLAKNQISNLHDDVFSGMPKLESINIDGNRITTLNSKAFESVSGTLKKLFIEDIGTNVFPTTLISSLSELTILELNSNPISTIPDGALDNFGKLERLDMNKCELGPDSITPSTFRNLNSLKFLNIGFNQISSIPDGSFDSFRDTLESLYIEHNDLSTLSGDLLNWQNIKTLNISDNPWECTCEIAWMADLDMTRLYDGFTPNLTCYGPPDVVGKSLKNVTSSLEGCPGASRSSMIALAITIPIIIICAGLIAYYLYKIIQARRQRGQRKSVRYSEVYRDTVESTNKPPRPPRPVSEL